MTESQNSVAEGQISDTSQPIGDCLNKVSATVDAIETSVAGDGGVTVELGRDDVKRKRGRPPKGRGNLNQNPKPKATAVKRSKQSVVVPGEDEDVCFICFDGGSLVLCDHRGCPKAYHPACIKRDEAFFESAAKWNCGWHICSICQKTAHHMCYTCTYSLCRGCIKKADYVCVRGDKGFCTICMKMIKLIENNGQGEDGKVQVDFDDKLSWEYLFKVYWVYLKGKLSLTDNEITEAKNPWREVSTISSHITSNKVHNRAHDLRSITSSVTSSTPVINSDENESKRRKIDDEVNTPEKETVNIEIPKTVESESATVIGCNNWATKELMDFVAHMKNGDTSVLSRIDVKALLKEYINKNNLRDAQKKNQIICDERLMSLFGKPRVGHVQMSKLLEGHFFVKEGLPKTSVKRTTTQDDADWTGDNVLKVSKDKKRRNSTKGEERALQNKLDDFAAVNVDNMNLIYLRRDLIVNLLDDSESFHEKVVGSIVRIRILGSDLQHDMYRLVQVVGTSKVDVPYKIGNVSTNVMLEVLNLDKKETISIDTVSDKDFSEEECSRLKRSIRCGLVKHFTVGEIQEKAVALQPLKLNDWTEKETLRLTRLRDVASEEGHKKRYKEYVEKLQLLKKPDEQERRLQQIPVVHSDPKMNPRYESDDTEEYFNKEHDHMESKHSGDSIKNSRSPKRRAARLNDSDEKPANQIVAAHSNIEAKSTKATETPKVEKQESGSTSEESQQEIGCNNGSTNTKLDQQPQPTLSSSVSNSTPETISSSPSDVGWHYLDPNGKVQGPFSLVQLQRWSTTGYFPADMRIWSTHKDNSLLLNDVLKQQFPDYYVLDKNITTSNKTDSQIERPSVGSTIQSSNPAAVNHDSGPKLSANNNIQSSKPADVNHDSGQKSSANNNIQSSKPADVNHDGQKLSVNSNIQSSNPAAVIHDSQSRRPKSRANNNLNCNPASVDSTVGLNSSNTAAGNMEGSTVCEDAALFSLPGPTPAPAPAPAPAPKMVNEDEKIHSVVDSKVCIQDSSIPSSWSSASNVVVSGPELNVPVSGNELVDSEIVVSASVDVAVGGDHVATSTSNVDIDINSSQITFKPVDVAVGGDHVATSTSTSNIDININNNNNNTSSQQLTWQGVGEMIEFSTLAEESVSDLLAEVDAMESQYGLPSPTSRRNSFVDDLFNGSFDDEFSPIPDQATRSDGSSSSADVQQLPCNNKSNSTTADEQQHLGFDFMNMSNGLQQQHSFITTGQTNCIIPQTTNATENIGFKWPEMIDINLSAKAEGDEGEFEIKASDVQVNKVKVENGNHVQPTSSVDRDVSGFETNHARVGHGSGSEMNHARVGHGLVKNPSALLGERAKESEPMQEPKSTFGAKFVNRVAQIKGAANHRRAKDVEDGEFVQPEPSEPLPPPPPPPPPLTLGLDPFDPSVLESETMQSNFNHTGRPRQGRSGTIGWDRDRDHNQNQRRSGDLESETLQGSLNHTERPRQGRSGTIGWDRDRDRDRDQNHRWSSGDRHNSSNSPRERSHQVDESGHSRSTRSSYNRQSSFSNGNSGGGPMSPLQRMCRFFLNGKCRKGSSCKYLHSSRY
ncbi:uncharacterized protein [Rutidosis leptorrhynchoides]|uniref:uncharacterized protein n=1 Tax=Rutidosis leptorrhynchoides TaxID=125765 RepID=UPI003A98D6AE